MAHWSDTDDFVFDETSNFISTLTKEFQQGDLVFGLSTAKFYNDLIFALNDCGKTEVTMPYLNNVCFPESSEDDLSFIGTAGNFEPAYENDTFSPEKRRHYNDLLRYKGFICKSTDEINNISLKNLELLYKKRACKLVLWLAIMDPLFNAHKNIAYWFCNALNSLLGKTKILRGRRVYFILNEVDPSRVVRKAHFEFTSSELRAVDRYARIRRDVENMMIRVVCLLLPFFMRLSSSMFVLALVQLFWLNARPLNYGAISFIYNNRKSGHMDEKFMKEFERSSQGRIIVPGAYGFPSSDRKYHNSELFGIRNQLDSCDCLSSRPPSP